MMMVMWLFCDGRRAGGTKVDALWLELQRPEQDLSGIPIRQIQKIA